VSKAKTYLKNIHIQRIRSKRTTFQGEPAYDVREIGVLLVECQTPFYFELRGFDDNGVLYFDIGVRKSDGSGPRHRSF
jgi:hypothetical protein